MIVVAAVDGSEHTQKVVQTAYEFARGDATHLVYVTGEYIYPYMVTAGYLIDFDAIRKSQAEAVWNTVGSLPKNATAVTLEGLPASAIVDYAKKVKADLIVIGSRGRGDLESLLLGSVSHGVIHGADRNVLIVR